MTLRAITRRFGEPIIATSAPRSGWRGSVREPEIGPARSRRSTRCPPIQRISLAAGATAIEILLEGRTPENLDEQTLLDAGKRAAALNLESATKRAAIRLRVLGAALDWLREGNKTTAARLLGAAFDEPGIRIGMERSYRELAHQTTDTWERIALVERANEIRPRTRV